jgi:hypothetical protein
MHLGVTISTEMVTALLVRAQFSGLFLRFKEAPTVLSCRSGFSYFQAWKC